MYDITQFLTSVRRRSRLAIALFITFSIIGFAAVMLMPRSYTTTSQVLVKRPDTALQSTTYPQIDALLAWNRDTAMETYVALARQPAVAERVIRGLDLKITPRDLLTRNVAVTPLTNSDIINIAVDSRDAGESATVANAFARVFIERQRALAAAQASDAADSLSVALGKAQTDLTSAERALTLFESQNELADATAQTTAILSALSDVQSKERGVDAERAQAQAQLSRIDAQLAALPATIDASKVISGSPVADQMEQELAQQQVHLRLLEQQFTSKYPEVIATKQQIATLQSSLQGVPRTKLTSRNVAPNPLGGTLASQSATLGAQVAGDVAQLGVLRSQEASLHQQLRVFPRDVSQLAKLQRQEKAAESIYNALQSNYFNAVVAKSMAVSDLSIIQYADPALATVRPPRLLSLLAVALVALVATLAMVALLEGSPAESVSLSEVR